MPWNSLALDTYNMYLEKDAISRGSRFTAWISNWFILTGYVILPQTMAAVAREQTTAMRSTTIFKFNVTNIQAFAISCLIIGHVSMVFLCCRYFNNLIFRLETILIPTLSAEFVGVISCLFNFVGRRGVAFLEANTMALLTFSSVAFVLMAIASISTTLSLHAHRVLARIKYQEKWNHVVSPGFRSGPKTPYSQFSNPSTATDLHKPGMGHKKDHSRSTSASSRKHLLNIFTMGPNPAQESNTTITTFIDTNSNNNNTNNNVATQNETRTLGQTLDPHLITQTSTIGGTSHPTSPILHTANFAIPVRAPNPAAWKPNQTIHESESRTHSRNTSSVYSFLPDVESQFPQPPVNHIAAAVPASNVNAYGATSAAAVAPSNSVSKKSHISTSSYATYLPGSEENSPSSPPPPLPPIPSTSCMTPMTNTNGPPGRNTAIANDVAELLNEANQVLIGFTHPSQPHSPSSSHIPSFYKQREMSYAPSEYGIGAEVASSASQYNRAPSPHPAMFLTQLATQAAPTSAIGNSQSQSMFLGELTDCYKYSQYGYPGAYPHPQQQQPQNDNLDIGRALGPKTPVTNGKGYDFYATGDMRNSIISTGSVSKQRRSKNTSMSSVIELLGRKGSLTEQSYSGGLSEEDRIKEVNMRSPVKNYSGIYV